MKLIINAKNNVTISLTMKNIIKIILNYTCIYIIYIYEETKLKKKE